MYFFIIFPFLQVTYKGAISGNGRHTVSLQPTWSHLSKATAEICHQAALSDVTIFSHFTEIYKQVSLLILIYFLILKIDCYSNIS